MELDDVQRASQEQFARQSRHYGQGHILEKVGDIEAALQDLDLPPRARVLDVATGAGHTGLFFASLGHDVTLSDIAAPMLTTAEETAAKRGIKVTTQTHPAEELPYPAGQFDLVTCRVAAHHFSSPERFIQETARVLRPGGAFLLIDGTVEDGHPEAEAWAHAVEKFRDPSHHRFVSPQSWARLCASAGLRVRRLTITPFKQPDLYWYFQAASTSPENRQKVLELIAQAPESARRLFRLGEEDGKIVWWWQR
ncbi:MAG TPA: class I SAM-dependent methyltransferase, partial [Prosthecobacter sp.]|nr:class I SAM-dependent methyltransferase [Prosthecobacter sp.]